MKSRLLVLGIGIHFFLILTVVTHLDEWMGQFSALNLISALDNYYSAVTFTNRNFGFFAPEVTSDWNVQLFLTDRLGHKRTYSFNLENREMKVKMYSMLGHFGDSEDTMDLFARSWALKAINENPGVTQVDIEVKQNYIPSMAEYRQGKRITANLLYRTTFDAS
jgi:hypothetical protein